MNELELLNGTEEIILKILLQRSSSLNLLRTV